MKKQELLDWLDYCYKELAGFAGVRTSEESENHFRDVYLVIKDMVQKKNQEEINE